SIIGAGAVVTKDIPESVVVAGNPAKVLSSVENYMKKCEERGVLYDVTDEILKKHGTKHRATPEETEKLKESIYKQYKERNQT
ncbi:MAG: hypothetical protein GX879_10080, partial [Bacteroidales bacterium]|nr:hypothetical protein [Bacteroidales bacterium]